mmetsp:Transcript_3188/g.11545  ORF Transcript_3188/g.11545 Transcript_3188/m.11545 type:complete len:94 (+) Transcript_3188:1068-1349(+)
MAPASTERPPRDRTSPGSLELGSLRWGGAQKSAGPASGCSMWSNRLDTAEMPHRRASMGTIPRSFKLSQIAELSDHLGTAQSGANHDAASASS